MLEILKWRQLGIDHGIQVGIQFLPTFTRGRKGSRWSANGQSGTKRWAASSLSLPESLLTSQAVSALRNEVTEKHQSVRSLDVGFSRGSKKPSLCNNHLSFYSEEELRRD